MSTINYIRTSWQWSFDFVVLFFIKPISVSREPWQHYSQTVNTQVIAQERHHGSKCTVNIICILTEVGNIDSKQRWTQNRTLGVANIPSFDKLCPFGEVIFQRGCLTAAQNWTAVAPDEMVNCIEGQDLTAFQNFLGLFKFPVVADR